MRTRRPSARRAVTVVLAALAALAAAGCSDGESGAINDPIDVAEVGVTAIAQADVMACQADRTAVETAVDAYTTLNGGPPASEQDLVGTFLREPSGMWDIDASGTIVPAPGSGC